MTNAHQVTTYKIIGPIVLSALSLFLTFHLLQPVALLLDPTFSLLANRSVGKIAFTIMVLVHIVVLLTTVSRSFMQSFVATNFSFIYSRKWLAPFFSFFIGFFCLHSFLLWSIHLFTPAIVFVPQALVLFPTKIGSLLWGFVATFFLAWTEETIFRGMLFTYFNQQFSTLSSTLLASFIFSLAHNLTNPLALLTHDWTLGVGLFLLGFFLNTVFAITKKLYIGMGIHAGLVFVKVFIRRIPCVVYSASFPWWFNSDLRQSLVIHMLFLVISIVLWIIFRKTLTRDVAHTE